ncbi:MAG: type 1 glutamine amidotransferase [Leptolyngbyaceae cyanobacterium CRU_2_3]|nr:type 1 glutamine amidotransferase [Leptolyngbyaceae cyanobacterium CRU_2_3]
MSNNSTVLVIRHEQCSSLGLLKVAFDQAKIPFVYLDTHRGETLIDPLSYYSHIVVLGGAVSAYEADQYPYLRYEFALLEKAIQQGMPVLGICLGSQILAHVLGGRVYRGELGREAGWCELELTPDGSDDPVLGDLPAQFKVFQSHQDTFDIPPECVHLAQSGKYPNQAFRYREHVWAIQFHPEIDENVLGDCSAVIEQELIDSKIHDTTLEQLLEEARLHSPAVAPLAAQMMWNFLQIPSRRIEKSIPATSVL